MNSLCELLKKERKLKTISEVGGYVERREGEGGIGRESWYYNEKGEEREGARKENGVTERESEKGERE